MYGFLFGLLTSIPVAVFMTGIVRIAFGNGEKYILQYVMAIAFATVFTGIRALNKKRRVILLASLAAFIGFYAFMLLTNHAPKALTNPLAVVIPAACAFVAALICRVKLKVDIFGYIMVGLTFGLLVFAMIMKYNVTVLDTSAGLFFTMTVLSELVQKTWKRVGADSHIKHTVTIAPFILAGVVAMAFIPSPEKPYDWKFVVKTYEFLKEEYIKISEFIKEGDNDRYKEAFIGFSSDGELVYENGENNHEVFVFSSSFNHASKGYLKGTVFDSFDGREWTCNYSDSSYDVFLDTAQTMIATKGYSGNVTPFYCVSDSKISLLDYSTKHYFIPQKSIFVTDTNEAVKITYKDGSTYSGKTMRYGDEYEFVYIDLNTNSEEFDEFARNGAILDKEKFDLARKQIVFYDSIINTKYEDVVAREEEIHKEYATDVEISDDAKAFVDEITKDAKCDYDKALMICEALKSMTYTTKVSKLPKKTDNEADFLDYMLFESREGFCVHYATAMVLLARAEGIPARYVQGYYLDVPGSEPVYVNESDAHAWAEVYIDGIGWIIFDATPGYGYSEIGKWGAGIENNSDVSIHKAITLPEIEEEPEENPESARVWLFLLIPIATALAFAILFLVIERNISSKRFAKANNRKKLIEELHEFKKLAGMAGVGIRSDETLEEYSKRTKEFMGDEMINFVKACEKTMYSDYIPTKEDVNEYVWLYDSLIALVKKKRGYIGVLWAKTVTRNPYLVVV